MKDAEKHESVSDYARKKLIKALRVIPRDLLRKEMTVIQGGKLDKKYRPPR